MCINFSTGNICCRLILFLIILCSVSAGKAQSPGLLWLDSSPAQTNRHTGTALFVKSKALIFLSSEMQCFSIDAERICFSLLSLFSSHALDSTAEFKKKAKLNNNGTLKWTPAIQSKQKAGRRTGDRTTTFSGHVPSLLVEGCLSHVCHQG